MKTGRNEESIDNPTKLLKTGEFLPASRVCPVIDKPWLAGWLAAQGVVVTL
jgi:hypothetical protein